MAEETLDSRGLDLFQRNPLVGMLSIVVASNALPGARVEEINSQKWMLPDWGAEEWAWWLRTCIGAARAMEGARPEDAPPMDSALGDEYAVASGLLDSDGSLRRDLAETIDGARNDGIGWLRFVAPIVLAGGKLVAKQGLRAAKWGAKHAKKAGAAAWVYVSGSAKKAPMKVLAGITLLAAPDTAVKVVTTAGKMAGSLFGSAAGALVSGAGPIGLLAIGAILYFAFRGRGATD